MKIMTAVPRIFLDMSYVESQKNITKMWILLSHGQSFKSNTLFVLTYRTVTVLYVALCPGELKITFSQALLFFQTAALDFSPKPCLFLNR